MTTLRYSKLSSWNDHMDLNTDTATHSLNDTIFTWGNDNPSSYVIDDVLYPAMFNIISGVAVYILPCGKILSNALCSAHLYAKVRYDVYYGRIPAYPVAQLPKRVKIIVEPKYII